VRIETRFVGRSAHNPVAVPGEAQFRCAYGVMQLCAKRCSLHICGAHSGRTLQYCRQVLGSNLDRKTSCPEWGPHFLHNYITPVSPLQRPSKSLQIHDESTVSTLKESLSNIAVRNLCAASTATPSVGIRKQESLFIKQLMVRERNNYSSPPPMLLAQHVSAIRPSSGGVQ
jgi:hypothetical protein